MKESDWKLFKEIRSEALELFCENSLKEYSEIISDESKPIPCEQVGMIHKQAGQYPSCMLAGAAVFSRQTGSFGLAFG